MQWVPLLTSLIRVMRYFVTWKIRKIDIHIRYIFDEVFINSFKNLEVDPKFDDEVANHVFLQKLLKIIQIISMDGKFVEWEKFVNEVVHIQRNHCTHMYIMIPNFLQKQKPENSHI